MLKAVEQSKILIGMCALATFLGSNEVSQELYAGCRNIFLSKYAQQFVVFSIVFLYSKSIPFSLGALILLIIIYPEILLTDGFCKSRQSREEEAKRSLDSDN